MMIIRQNRYTVKEEYAAQNQKLISQVIEELQALGRLDIRYSVFVEDDANLGNSHPDDAHTERHDE
jgi:hypothetical protein